MGAVAQSFTLTVQAPVTQNEAAILERDVVRYRRVKKKGYVHLHTNFSDLNLESHCDLVPKTCENFTIFHQSIRHFMIQGGDPMGTGKGRESYWGKPFKDEFKPNGKVVGGIEALSKMEKVETDDTDKPKEIIKLTNMSVIVAPFEEVDKLLEEKDNSQEEKALATKSSKTSSSEKPMKAFHSGVGKYIKPQP